VRILGRLVPHNAS
jgi:serine/threonine-protein kinase mTOR